MRKDEHGGVCPETLGEYRDLCAALAPESEAVLYLDELIAKQGRSAIVLAPDSDMRAILMPRLIVTVVKH